MNLNRIHEQNRTTPELSFEQALARLEQIAKQLEDQQLGLENSLTIYAEGVQLLRQCQSLLTTAERKIELLTALMPAGMRSPNRSKMPRPFVAEQAASSQAGLTSRKRKSSLVKRMLKHHQHHHRKLPKQVLLINLHPGRPRLGAWRQFVLRVIVCLNFAAIFATATARLGFELNGPITIARSIALHMS